MKEVLVSVNVAMKRLLTALLGSLLMLLLLTGVAATETKPEFRLGFKALAEQIPDVVGYPLEDEHWDANGDSLQQTSQGLMVWRKADNQTTFVPSTRTLANEPSVVHKTTSVSASSRSEVNLSNIYIGALHSMHTAYSDGAASYPKGFYSQLKPLWDWAATTDHDVLLSGDEWKSIVENARIQNDEKFVSFAGYEWTSVPSQTQPSRGHMSVVFQGYDRLGDRVPASSNVYDSPHKFYPVVEAMNGLAVFAHPARRVSPIDFNNEAAYRNDSVVPLVSVVNAGVSWSRSWEYARGSGIYSGWQAGDAFDGGWPRLALDRGYRLGFVGEYDGHGAAMEPARYGYTGVVANSLTRGGIFDGLRARHTYAVFSPYGVGKRILLKASSGDYLMGDAFRAASNPLPIRLRGKTDLVGFRAISLVVNGMFVEERVVSGNEIDEEFTVYLPAGDNYTFFVVQAESPDDPRIREPQHRQSMALTSPMFITVNK